MIEPNFEDERRIENLSNKEKLLFPTSPLKEQQKIIDRDLMNIHHMVEKDEVGGGGGDKNLVSKNLSEDDKKEGGQNNKETNSMTTAESKYDKNNEQLVTEQIHSKFEHNLEHSNRGILHTLQNGIGYIYRSIKKFFIS